jgi:hypothetical protein
VTDAGSQPVAVATNYLDELAIEIFQTCHLTANKPDADDMGLYRIYAVLCRSLGSLTGNEDVHDAWSAWMAGKNPEHRSLLPFAQLAAEVQYYDQTYRDAIRRVASRRFGRKIG